MLGGDRELLAKRGSELNINAAQNFMTPGAKEQIAVLLGKNSDMFHAIREVSGEVQGIRSDYQSILDSLRARGQWGTYKNQ